MRSSTERLSTSVLISAMSSLTPPISYISPPPASIPLPARAPPPATGARVVERFKAPCWKGGFPCREGNRESKRAKPCARPARGFSMLWPGMNELLKLRASLAFAFPPASEALKSSLSALMELLNGFFEFGLLPSSLLLREAILMEAFLSMTGLGMLMPAQARAVSTSSALKAIFLNSSLRCFASSLPHFLLGPAVTTELFVPEGTTDLSSAGEILQPPNHPLNVPIRIQKRE
mmetsp:Transcript_40783/g.115359  ORF Transcript_40783/g.115359 Transcript_40783/m.115359 type:complete len:233 (+) Transcript_40783:368-1066(+)